MRAESNVRINNTENTEGRGKHTRYRFSPTGVGNVDELFEEDGVFTVVPVTEDDRKFAIVDMRFPRWVKHDRRTEAVNVLSLLTISKAG